jgi:hypothetical protein
MTAGLFNLSWIIEERRWFFNNLSFENDHSPAATADGTVNKMRKHIQIFENSLTKSLAEILKPEKGSFLVSENL